MTKQERKEVIHILSELQSKVKTQKSSSAANRKAALTRCKDNPSTIEDRWLRRWEKLVIANDAVDTLLSRLIDEQQQQLNKEMGYGT